MTAGRADALGGAFDLALARAVPTIPDGLGMSYEPKFDGVRAAIIVEAGRAKIWSRNGTDLTTTSVGVRDVVLMFGLVRAGYACATSVALHRGTMRTGPPGSPPRTRSKKATPVKGVAFLLQWIEISLRDG